MTPPINNDEINWGHEIFRLREDVSEIKPKVERIPYIEDKINDWHDAATKKSIWPYATAVNGLMWLVTVIGMIAFILK